MPMPDTSMQYIDAMLGALGTTGDNLTSSNLLQAWMQEEGTSSGSSPNYVGKIHNPLDTSLNESGARNYNSAGVKSYPSFQSGVNANVATLEEPQYAVLRKALVEGNSKLFFSSQGQQEFLVWAGGSQQALTNLHSDYNSISGSQSPLAPGAAKIANKAATTTKNAVSAAKNAVSGVTGAISKNLWKWALIVVLIVVIGLLFYRGVVGA